MSAVVTRPRIARDLRYFELKQQIEDFLYGEADLLDQRRFMEWLDLLAEDLVYFMPMRRNVKFGEHEASENTRFGEDISWFEEDKWTLTKRVEQIMTGVHWAEEPLSRVCHMVTNVQLLEARPSIEAPEEVTVRSRFLVYQNRVEYETYFFVGKRTDVLRAVGGEWKLARREILLDQNVLLAKNLTVFF
jgi:3-phenylpropionate/cinnamic acid dioxygenase small subunit